MPLVNWCIFTMTAEQCLGHIATERLRYYLPYGHYAVRGLS